MFPVDHPFSNIIPVPEPMNSLNENPQFPLITFIGPCETNYLVKNTPDEINLSQLT